MTPRRVTLMIGVLTLIALVSLFILPVAHAGGPPLNYEPAGGGDYWGNEPPKGGGGPGDGGDADEFFLDYQPSDGLAVAPIEPSPRVQKWFDWRIEAWLRAWLASVRLWAFGSY